MLNIKDDSEVENDNSFGWYKHTLTVDDLPKFNHNVGDDIIGYDDCGNSIKLSDVLGSRTCNQVYVKEQNATSPIKSNGGSSDYYKVNIPKHLTVEKNGNVVFETGDIIRYLLNNDFVFGNIFKAMVRVVSKRNGVGKQGVDEIYDLNKIKYFIEDEIKQLNKTKEEK